MSKRQINDDKRRKGGHIREKFNVQKRGHISAFTCKKGGLFLNTAVYLTYNEGNVKGLWRINRYKLFAKCEVSREAELACDKLPVSLTYDIEN